jgi:hypothetical protein
MNAASVSAVSRTISDLARVHCVGEHPEPAREEVAEQREVGREGGAETHPLPRCDPADPGVVRHEVDGVPRAVLERRRHGAQR